MNTENYVYKKEIDWSVLNDGFTLPIEGQVIFLQNMDRFLERGEKKTIHLIFCSNTYDVTFVNVNNPIEKRKKDAYQIRYSGNSDFARALQLCFATSYQYIKTIRENRDPKDRSMIKLPEEMKEYMAIYTTEYDDTFLIEPIIADDIAIVKNVFQSMDEQSIETEFDYNTKDETSGIEYKTQINKVRKLNRAIGNNLKLLYEYRCQICGRLIGEEYDTHIAEAHHIDYFVKSMNNDANNILIVCPNHHRIIHNANPIFDRTKLVYKYENGIEEKLKINKHLV